MGRRKQLTDYELKVGVLQSQINLVEELLRHFKNQISNFERLIEIKQDLLKSLKKDLRDLKENENA